MELSGPPPEASDRPERLRLKVAQGNAAGTVIEVEDELVIGRQAPEAGSLGNDIEISRQHARIWCGTDGGYLIEDLGSTNGTFVNERLVEGPTPLMPGDRIELGASALIVQVSAVPPTPPSTPITTAAQTEPPLEPATQVPSPPGAEPVGAEPPLEVGGSEGAEPTPAPSGIPPVRLRIDIDVEAGVATVSLDDDSAELTLLHEDGRWRLGPGA